MVISPYELKQFQIRARVYDSLKYAPKLRDRFGITKEDMAKRKERIDDYLGQISDPVKREAMRAAMYTGCTARQAAAVALDQNTDPAKMNAVQRYVTDELQNIENRYKQERDRLQNKIRKSKT